MKCNLLKTLQTVSLVFAIVCIGWASASSADEGSASRRVRIYDEKADGFKQVSEAVAQAKREGKRVLLDFGYNECSWCQKLHTLFETDKQITQRLKSDYLIVYIHTSRQHNLDVDAKYQARSLYGAPSLVVLDSDGTRLTTKDTGELEENDHHDPKKVLTFLEKWARTKQVKN